MEIVGADPKIIETIKQIGLLSQSRFPVVIEGESGTGKELVARALHDATSPGAPFVALNCSAVVPTLFESALFGHEKGAFTGAEAMKVGRLENVLTRAVPLARDEVLTRAGPQGAREAAKGDWIRVET
jgi:DNA-binding NtrC family response regulator